MTAAHLTILDVGHGNAAVLTGPDATVLVDTGPSPWVLGYLEDQGLGHLDAVAITHSDEDHLKGLIALLDADTVSIDTVRVNSDAKQTSSLWSAVSFSLDQLSRRREVDYQLSLAAGDQLPAVASGITLEVLGPSRYLASRGPGSTDHRGRPLVSNSVSAVVMVCVQAQPYVLLMADIDQLGLESLFSDHDVRAPVLVFPHHGGNMRAGATSNDNVTFTRMICEAVEPEVVIFSMGRGRYDTPRPEIVRTIRECGGEIRIACTQLAEACAAALPDGAAFEHLNSLPARGRSRQMCCAGTIRIPLLGDIAPAQQAYDAFKRQHAKTALCRP